MQCRIVSMMAIVLLASATPAAAQTCRAGHAALGTERVFNVDPRMTPKVGRKHFSTSLPLRPGEVVLTFDDGPWPATTPAVLDALKRECVRATFFLVGGRAVSAPALVRRAAAEGHTIGTHTYSHPLLNRMPAARAEAEIDRGIAAVASVLGRPPAPFFRFPGFASTPQLLGRLTQPGLVVFGADLWASDWRPMPPAVELDLVMRRLRSAGGGIVLFHDTKAQTAAMLPALLRMLKREGYRVVHAVPLGHSAMARASLSDATPGATADRSAMFAGGR